MLLDVLEGNEWMILSFVGFQLMYWLTDGLNAMIFPAYRKMNRIKKNYWRASIVRFSLRKHNPLNVLIRHHTFPSIDQSHTHTYT